MTLHIDYAYAASLLNGALRRANQFEFDITATGVLDGSTGATRSGTTLDASGRRLGETRAETRAAVVKALSESDEARNKLLEAVDKLVRSDYDSLKTAEKAWRTPNTCASMILTPASAALDEDETKTVQGKVLAKDGQPADGRWKVDTLRRGSVKTLPGTSTAAQPIKLDHEGRRAQRQ